jgi:hypothetical protein
MPEGDSQEPQATPLSPFAPPRRTPPMRPEPGLSRSDEADNRRNGRTILRKEAVSTKRPARITLRPGRWRASGGDPGNAGFSTRPLPEEADGRRRGEAAFILAVVDKQCRGKIRRSPHRRSSFAKHPRDQHHAVGRRTASDGLADMKRTPAHADNHHPAPLLLLRAGDLGGLARRGREPGVDAGRTDLALIPDQEVVRLNAAGARHENRHGAALLSRYERGREESSEGN